MKAKVLVVDDDDDINVALQQRLQMLGYDSVSAEDGEQALEQIHQESPHVVLLDLELPKLSGLEILRKLREQASQQFSPDSADRPGYELVRPFVVVMTAYGSIDEAVEAMKCGAYDFLTKPFDFDHLAMVLQRILERTSLLKEVEYLRKEINHRYAKIIGASPPMKEALAVARQVAPSPETVLLLGETGTGKDILARSIHRWSAQRNGPFMAVNCSAFPETLLENELFGHEKGAFTGATEKREGKIEAADGGTVFLDEIGDMPYQLQGRLLRLLQDQEFHRVGGTKSIKVNVRFIAATNKDLQKGIANGTFREDLFFRLNILPITLPPLRERMADLPELANYFISRHCRHTKKLDMTVTACALEAMMHYHWPGNIRELESVVARAVILSSGGTITADDLRLQHHKPRDQEPPSKDETPVLSFRKSMECHSRFLLTNALTQTGWNQTKAAESLQIHRSYLVRMVKRLGISSPGSS
ncbi:MAG: acetoacetate metabolism regulatory protein AtoC [Nitrospirales bacterium]|nr:MAG: acetoacetate metabolism regulatory protein AtoC [Nitrospirales bacterium]